jgi:hypothetical protein
MKKVGQIFRMSGFRVVFSIRNGEFEAICGDLDDPQVLSSFTAKVEHVGEIERHKGTIKGRCQCIYNK